MDNMELYNKGRSVPKEAQKPFNNGKFSGTDINPMWRIKMLTEMFGPCGIGWYYEVISERSEEHGDVTMAIVDLNLYIYFGGEWSKPIYGTGGNVLLRKGSPSDEGYKMALTDALSVACKALGIGADVYFEKDTTKYTSQEKLAERKETAKDAKPVNRPICTDCGNAIQDYISSTGKVSLTASEIAAKSLDAYGRQLCTECSRKARMDQAQALVDRVNQTEEPDEIAG